MKAIKGINNNFKETTSAKGSDFFKNDELIKAYNFHSSIPDYQKTPLVSLKNLSEYSDVNNIYIKDESKRFGLNAFKGLGVSYAIADYYAKQLGISLSEVSFTELKQKIENLPSVVFTTATDGNHGKGLAWAARLFGQTAKVFMPKGASTSRLNAIREFGAEATETKLNYDDTVQMVAEKAIEEDWVVIQDTAWEGYEEIPLAIMQGYSTIISEVYKQLSSHLFQEVTHVFLQAGVGSFAAALASTIQSFTTEKLPKIIVVEPNQANCLYQSAYSEKGAPIRVYGDLNTIMAGLACGSPSSIAWELLKPLVSHFYSCSDEVSINGMQVLGKPIGDDKAVISGEAGALPLGVVYEVLNNPEYKNMKNELDLNNDSNILVISTEGDTDPENYKNLVFN